MRLCVLTTSYPRYSGDDAGVFVKRLIDALAEEGASGVVLSPFDRNSDALEVQGQFTVYRLKYGVFSPGALAFGAGILPNIKSRPLLFLQAPGLLCALVAKALTLSRQYEALHANWLFCGLAAWIVSLLTGKKYVVTVRGEDMKLLRNRATRAIFAPSLFQAAAIITVSDAFESELHQRFPSLAKKINCIPNGVSLPLVSESQRVAIITRYKLASNKKYLLSVGRVIPLKRIEVVIDLCAALGDEFVLLVCGRAQSDTYLSSLKERAASKGILDRVVFLGAVSSGDIPALLSLSWCFVSASEYEGRPNAVLEALSAGIPPILSDIEAHRALVRDDESGFLFGFDDVGGVAARMISLASDVKRYEQLQTRARTSVAGLTWRSAAHAYLKLLQ